MRTRQQCKNRGHYTLIFDTETTGLFPKKRDFNPDPSIASKKNISNKKTRELQSLDIHNDMYPITYNSNEEYVLHQNPHITQIGYMIVQFSSTHPTIIKCVNKYITLPDGVHIPDKVTEITGITDEICAEKGEDVVLTLVEFLRDIEMCDEIVGHNISFDINIIRCQIIRYYDRLVQYIPYVNAFFNPAYDSVIKPEHYCTMIRTIKLCKILVPTIKYLPTTIPTTTTSLHPKIIIVKPPSTNPFPTQPPLQQTVPPQTLTQQQTVPPQTPLQQPLSQQPPQLQQTVPPIKMKFKWPKLSELYYVLFLEKVDNLHNAFVDVLVCMRCYIKLKYRCEMSDIYFNKLLENASKNNYVNMLGEINSV